ncbi:hypothetical protein [Natronorubrum sp. FCH18a]|uniref:hypothetical protein n=1 Tax=Natronorubrum sp. FCH18a TaxID=3447018 RepID=UPI003F51A3FF
MSEFVPASRLYDVESRTPIAHPAHQATDADVRHALEEREIRADGGHSSSDTERRVDELKERVAELESIINRELGYSLGEPPEPQTVDCDCGESFEVNVLNGLVCPECGVSHG